MGVTRAALEPRLDLDMRIRALKLELPGYAKWSSVKPLDQVFEALLEVAKT